MLQGLNVAKGERLDITKGTGIIMIDAALGWDAETLPGKPTCDLDASVFCRDANGKVIEVLYYNSPKSAQGKLAIFNDAIIHSGDELTGSKAGDDEKILLDLSKIPANVVTVSIVITIYDAMNKNQNFGQVKNAYVRIDNAADNAAIIKFDLTEDYSKFTSIYACDIYRHGNEWKFAAKGEGRTYGDLNGFYSEWK